MAGITCVKCGDRPGAPRLCEVCNEEWGIEFYRTQNKRLRERIEQLEKEKGSHRSREEGKI